MDRTQAIAEQEAINDLSKSISSIEREILDRRKKLKLSCPHEWIADEPSESFVAACYTCVICGKVERNVANL